MSSSLRRRSVNSTRQSRYCSKVIASSASGRGAGCAASPGSQDTAATPATATNSIHFIGIPPGFEHVVVRTKQEYNLSQVESTKHVQVVFPAFPPGSYRRLLPRQPDGRSDVEALRAQAFA